jgi:ABC-2 type transport system permease protein
MTVPPLPSDTRKNATARAPAAHGSSSRRRSRGGGGPIRFSHVWADFVLYTRSYIRNPEALFFSLMFPFILVVLFGAIYSGSSTPSAVDLYVQNLDGGNSTTMAFYHYLGETGLVNIYNVSASVGNLSPYLSQHSYSNGLVIPKGFGEQVWNLTAGRRAGAPVNLTVYDNPFDASAAGIVSGAVQAVLNEFNQRGLPPVAELSAPVPVSSQSFTPKTIDYEVPGLIGFAILMNPMFGMVNITAEYKKEKLFKALSLTPLTKSEWLLSKILFNWALSAVAAIILFATGVLVWGAHVIVGPLLIPFLVVGPLLFVSLGMLIGTVSKRAETAGIIGNLVTFPMMFLSGSFIPVSVMPAWLQPYARIWPLYYIIDGIQSISVFDNTGQALFDLLLVTAMAVIVFVAAVFVFRWREE